MDNDYRLVIQLLLTCADKHARVCFSNLLSHVLNTLVYTEMEQLLVNDESIVHVFM